MNPNAKDFWKTVFLEGKIEIGEGKDKKVLTFAKWEDGKETGETIVRKLNGVKVTNVLPPPEAKKEDATLPSQ